VDNRIIPALYFNMKYPFGPVRRTRWTVFQFGLKCRFNTGWYPGKPVRGKKTREAP